PTLALPKIMDLGSTVSSGAGASAVLKVKYAITGLANPPVGPTVFIGGVNSDTATVDAYYDASNGNTVGSIVPAGVKFATITGSTAVGSVAVATGTYSLTELLTWDGTAAGKFLSSDVHLDTVPEPASVALLGGVLLFTANMLRRKKRA